MLYWLKISLVIWRQLWLRVRSSWLPALSIYSDNIVYDNIVYDNIVYDNTVYDNIVYDLPLS